MVKELGKMPPVTSGEGGPDLSVHLLHEAMMAAETRPKRLFTKNTGPC